MKVRHDIRCVTCGLEAEVWVQPYECPPCARCGQGTERIWKRTADVRDDTWPEGKTFENLGHEPVTVYSRSELKLELKKRGLEEFVRHVGVPGSDKSPHTSRWV